MSRLRGVDALLVAALSGCGSTATPSAETPSSTSGVHAEGGEAASLPITPEKPAPPGLTAAEARELGGHCAPLEERFYTARKAAIAQLDELLRSDPKAADADDKALAKALEGIAAPVEELSASDVERCVRLFTVDTRRKLFEHEPARQEAKSAVDTCVQRVDANFGKRTMSFDMGGGAPDLLGPFCPDDFPVPADLRQLPYTSQPEDWESPAWTCLQFGMRGEQRVQIEYSAPIGSSEFTCIARFLPRQGGAPIEIYRGGKIDDDGRLLIAPKSLERRMASP